MKILYNPDNKQFNFEGITHEEFRAIRRFMKDGAHLNTMAADRNPKKAIAETLEGYKLAQQIDGVKVPGL